MSAVILLATIAELALGAQLVSAGNATPEATVLATVFVLSSFGPFAALANLGATLQGTLASGARVLEILDEKPQADEVENGVGVTFSDASAEHVDFSYGAERVLSDVPVRILAGRIVGISGRSGSGKSTLARLLMRFWDVDQGRKASIHDFIKSLPEGTTPLWASLVGRSPRASGSAWGWPARFSTTHRSCSWTSPRATSTRSTRARCCVRSTRSAGGERRTLAEESLRCSRSQGPA